MKVRLEVEAEVVKMLIQLLNFIDPHLFMFRKLVDQFAKVLQEQAVPQNNSESIDFKEKHK